MIVELAGAPFRGLGVFSAPSFPVRDSSRRRAGWWTGIMLFLAFACHAQPGLEAYDRGDLDAVRSYLARGQGSGAEADFLRAALTVNADSAAQMYRQVAVKYPDSPISRRALERVRQYYYAQGLYDQAEEIEKSLSDKSVRPSPPPAADTSSIPVPQPSTPPLPTEPKPQPPPEIASPVPAAPGGYALQLGAFANPVNVKKLKERLEKAGYTIEIYPTTVGGKSLQAVRALGFTDREAALSAAQELKSKFGLNPILRITEK